MNYTQTKLTNQDIKIIFLFIVFIVLIAVLFCSTIWFYYDIWYGLITTFKIPWASGITLFISVIASGMVFLGMGKLFIKG